MIITLILLFINAVISLFVIVTLIIKLAGDIKRLSYLLKDLINIFFLFFNLRYHLTNLSIYKLIIFHLKICERPKYKFLKISK